LPRRPPSPRRRPLRRRRSDWRAAPWCGAVVWRWAPRRERSRAASAAGSELPDERDRQLGLEVVARDRVVGDVLGVCVTERAPIRRVDGNLRRRVSWALLAAGLLVSGLCVLCVLCGSSLSQRQKQKGTTEDTEKQSRANRRAAAGRPAAAVRGGRRGLSCRRLLACRG
jgi:hypothetical protein